MQIQMRSGNCDIVASNAVFLFDDSEELTILIDDDDGSRCCLKLRFLRDPSGKQRVEPVQSGDDRLLLKCFNFSARMGSGLAEPALIGESGGKNMYIMFWTSLFGSREPYTRSVQYTIFRHR